MSVKRHVGASPRPFRILSPEEAEWAAAVAAAAATLAIIVSDGRRLVTAARRRLSYIRAAPGWRGHLFFSPGRSQGVSSEASVAGHLSPLLRDLYGRSAAPWTRPRRCLDCTHKTLHYYDTKSHQSTLTLRKYIRKLFPSFKYCFRYTQTTKT